MGVPCVLGKNGVEKIIECEMSAKEKEMLAKSCKVKGSLLLFVFSIRKVVHADIQVLNYLGGLLLLYVECKIIEINIEVY